MGYIVFGVLLCCLAFGLKVAMKRKTGKMNHLFDTETSLVQNIVENYKGLSESFGKGNFSLYTEIKGIAVANEPFLTEFSKKECVYCESKLVREYEVLELNKANSTNEWKRRSETVSSNTTIADGFSLKDKTGTILVNPKGAKIDLEQTFSKFEKEDDTQAQGTKISFGRFSITTDKSSSTKRTLGYTYLEESILLNTPIYVIGEANDRSTELSVSKPREKGLSFIVSTKTEDELMADFGKKVKNYKIGAYVSLGLGGVLIVVGIISLFVK